MKAKNNKRELIYSLNDVRPSILLNAKRTAHLIGFLISLVVVLGCLVFDFFAHGSKELLFLCIDWFLMLATPIGAYLVGYLFGLKIALWEKGFAFVDGYVLGEGSSLHMNHSNSSSSACHGYSYSSSLSINPSSGRPMSGSSGVDTYGNPYGTRSW